MTNIFYACTAILLSIWAVCYFVLHAPAIIHTLPVIAFLSLVLSYVDAKQVED
jgi:hypothetical protein